MMITRRNMQMIIKQKRLILFSYYCIQRTPTSNGKRQQRRLSKIKNLRSARSSRRSYLTTLSGRLTGAKNCIKEGRLPEKRKTKLAMTMNSKRQRTSAHSSQTCISTRSPPFLKRPQPSKVTSWQCSGSVRADNCGRSKSLCMLGAEKNCQQ